MMQADKKNSAVLIMNVEAASTNPLRVSPALNVSHMQHNIGMVLKNANIASHVCECQRANKSPTKSTGRASANTLSVSAYGVSILCILPSARSKHDALIRLLADAARQVLESGLRIRCPSF